QSEALVSPVIDMTRYSTNTDENQDADIPPAALANMGGLVYRFTVYRDLLLSNLVFYTWGIRSIDETGCPTVFQDRNLVYYGEDKDYIQSSFDVSDLYSSNLVQFQIGVFDACDQWFDQYGDCAAHTPSPWIDNVRIYTYETAGPQWAVRSIDMFQDNFPTEEFNIESWVRIDMSSDLRTNDDPVIDPGDSAVIEVTAPLAGGLDTLPSGDERVYCHVWAEYIGIDAAKPDLYGPSLQGTYGTYVSDDGAAWTVFLMPNARNNNNEVVDRYMIDLNDSLFTRGYEIKYYFKAYDLNGESSVYPPAAENGGWMLEVTCLPTQNTEMLYVDDFHFRGAAVGWFDGQVQYYWDTAFEAVIPGNMPDRYDVNAPSSLISNGPGAYAYNYQMVNTYEKIIWDSGNLNAGTICEGTDYSDKSNDCQMLIDWMELSEHKTGLWIMGDDVADDLNDAPSASALALMSTYCGVSFVNDSYYDLTGGRVAGGVVTPQITGVPGSIYDGIQYYAFG
ncbi:MAG TPA: hypothetical protein VLA34_06870, partial [Candidatus Krumholzibacterium sp.]|nr:hypothetical protein [Candidatus Krumholzibacterium sp.]